MAGLRDLSLKKILMTWLVFLSYTRKTVRFISKDSIQLLFILQILVVFITEDEYNAYMESRKNVVVKGINQAENRLYNLQQSRAALMAQSNQVQINPSYSKENVHLAICAPLKDMNMQGMKLDGVHMVKDVPVPDPVVLMPKNHKNGTVGYLILTAWGDEASDELVVNQNNN